MNQAWSWQLLFLSRPRQCKPSRQRSTQQVAAQWWRRGGAGGGVALPTAVTAAQCWAGGGAPHSHPCTFVPNCSVILVMSRHNKPNLHNQWYRSIAKLLIFTKLFSFAPPVLLKTI